MAYESLNLNEETKEIVALVQNELEISELPEKLVKSIDDVIDELHNSYMDD